MEVKLIFKLIGAVVILISSIFIGTVLSNNYKKRPVHLKELQNCLYVLKSEMSFLMNYLPTALLNVYKTSHHQIGEIFKDCSSFLVTNPSDGVYAAWQKSIQKNISNTSLNQEDKNVILSFGRLLGETDLEMQINNILMMIEKLKFQEQKAEYERQKNQKISKSLSIMGGIAIVVLIF